MPVSFVVRRAPIPPVGLDPNKTYQDFTLSDGSRVITRDTKTASNQGASLSLDTFTTGRRYFEIECVDYNDQLWAGWADSVFAATDLSLAPGQSVTGNNTAWQASAQRKFLNGSYDNSAGSLPTDNDIVMCCIDLEFAMVWWGLNGTWFNYIGDPIGRPDISLYPHRIFTSSLTGSTIHAAISGEVGSTYRVKFANSDFTYTPPDSCYSIVDTIPTPTVPTYNALDPNNKSSSIRIFDGNETISRGRSFGTIYAPSILSEYGESTGKKYYEIKTRLGHGYFGIAPASTFNIDTFVGTGNSVGWHSSDRRMWANSGWNSQKGTSPTTDDIVMVAFDTATGNIWWGLNGTWFDGVDPGTGTGPHRTIAGLIGLEVFPAITADEDSYLDVLIRSSQWTYSPPTGFTEFAYGG